MPPLLKERLTFQQSYLSHGKWINEKRYMLYDKFEYRDSFYFKNINISKQPTNMLSLTQNDLIYIATNCQVKIWYKL